MEDDNKTPHIIRPLKKDLQIDYDVEDMIDNIDGERIVNELDLHAIARGSNTKMLEECESVSTDYDRQDKKFQMQRGYIAQDDIPLCPYGNLEIEEHQQSMMCGTCLRCTRMHEVWTVGMRTMRSIPSVPESSG